MKKWLTTLLLCLASLGPFAAVAEDQAKPSDAEAARWQRLTALTQHAQPIDTYRARFIQQKHTALLREPMVSRGQVRQAPGIARWETLEPYRSSMVIRDGRLKLYYPDEQTLEIYELGDRLDAMAGSPVPNVDKLREHFTLDAIERSEIEVQLTLLPRDEQMREAIESIQVSVDPARGCLTGMTLSDVDGDRTVMRFEDIELNVPLEAQSLRLEVPDDTKVLHPLEGIEG